MSYVILCDSCCDLTPELKKNPHIVNVPLTLMIDGKTIVDDETFDQKDFLAKMKASPEVPKSACPAPDEYMKHFTEGDEVYIVTLSGNLSGSFGSAKVAADIYEEDEPDKKVHIFDSHSSSVGECLLVMKIIELKENGASFDEVVERVTAYSDLKQTKFILESLETLRKNGRLTGLQAVLAGALNIKPVMGGTIDGHIVKLGQARGMVKAVDLMISLMEKDVTDPETRIIGVANCNCPNRAVEVRDKIMARIPFKDSIIVDTGGISSLYSNDGGLIIVY